MEFNPFKWFDRNKEYKEALRSKKCSVGVEVPEDVDINALNEKIEKWRKEAKKLGLEEGLAERKIAQLSDEIYALLGKTSEAEVLLANISIDLEVSRRAGKFDEIAYKGYGKLSEINVFNTILKGKTPEEMNKSLAWCYKTAAISLSVKTLLCSAIVVGGGIVGSAIGVPLLAAAVATTAGAVAGWHLGRTLSRHSSEKKFNETMEKLNELVSKKSGTENLSPEEVEHYTQELLKGGHRFGKKLGVDAKGRIDTESVPAQLLIRFSKLMQSRAQESELFPATQKEEQVANRVAQFTELYNELSAITHNVHISKQEGETAKAQYASLLFFLNNYQEELNKDEYQEFRHNVVSDLLEKLKIIIKWAGLDEPATQEELDKRTNELTQYINDIDIQIEEAYNRRVIMERGGAMNAMFRALRADQNKEKMHGAVGALTGALFSNLIRGAIAVEIKGQTVAEFVQSQLSTTGPWIDQHFFSEGDPSYSAKPPAPAVTPAPAMTPAGEQTATESAGQAEQAVPSDGEKPVVKAPSATGDAAQSEAAPEAVAQPSTEGIKPEQMTLANQYNFLYGEQGSEADSIERLTKMFEEQGIRLTREGDEFTLIAKVGEGLSNKDAAEDHILMQFLGKVMSGHVHDQLANAGAEQLTPEEKGALLNMMYNLRQDGLLSYDKATGTVTLQYDPEELSKNYEYSQSHDWNEATADDWAEKISSNRWSRWFGIESEEPKGSAVSEVSGSQKAGVTVEKAKSTVSVKDAADTDVPKIGSKEHIALERAGKVITDETIDRVPGIHPRPPTIPVEAATGSAQGITAEAVTARAPESITGEAIGRATESITAEAITQPQAEAPVSAQAEAPAQEKITARAVDVSEGKITGEAVSEEGTESVKAESVSERKAPVLTAEQVYQHMLDTLQKGKYAINPYVVEQAQSLRVSSFIERFEEVKAGKSDLMTAFSSDQYSLKEYEKLAKYITDHEPTATEKRMLLRNYLLSKEK